MTKKPQIESDEDLLAWLNARPEGARPIEGAILASRTALRMIPVFIGQLGEDWARNGELVALPVLRSCLISQIAAQRQTPQIREAAAAAREAGRSTTRHSEGNANTGEGEAADAATSADIAIWGVIDAANAPEAAVGAFSYAAGTRTYASELSNEVSLDTHELMRGQQCLRQPLWYKTMPPAIAAEWQSARDWLVAHSGHGFFIRWYEALLEGRPLTDDWDSHWALLTDIALIDSADWGRGAERIDDLISLIAQKHRLQHDISLIHKELENQLFNAQTLGHHRSNLPEDFPVSSVVQFRIALSEAHDALREVEAALEPPIPDAEALDGSIGRLRIAWKKVVKAAKMLIAAAALGAAGELGIQSMGWLIDRGGPIFVRTLRELRPKPSQQERPESGWRDPAIET